MSSEGSVFRRKSDGRFVAKWQDLNGKWRCAYKRTKSEAKAALRQALAERDAGMVPVGKMTTTHQLDEFLQELQDKVSERTYLNRESLVRNHIKPAIGTLQLAKLSHRDIHRLYRELGGVLAPSSVERIHVLLSQVLKIAARRRYLAINPMEEVTPPKVYRQERKILSPAQTKHLIASVRGHRFELAVVLGAAMALRVNEMLALQWEDVDLENGKLTVEHTLWKGERFNPKTQSSMAVMPIPAVALEALRRVRMTCTGTGYLSPTRSGRPLYAADFHKQWKKLCKQAGIPDITYHTLRHGAASYLLNAGVPLGNVSRFLRHSNPSITSRIYVHEVPGTEHMAAQGIDEALS